MTVRVLTQYAENYGFSEGKEHWKNKGGSEFEVDMPSEWMMYHEELVKELITNILAENCSDLVRYTVISMEPIFDKPIKIDAEDFARRFQLAVKKG